MWLPRAHPRTKSIRNPGDQVWASMFVFLFKKKTLPGVVLKCSSVESHWSLCPWEDQFLQDLELARSPQPQRGREGSLAPSLFHSNSHTERVHWLPGCLGSCQFWACLLWPGPWNRRRESVHRQWHSGCRLPGTFCGLIFLSRRGSIKIVSARQKEQLLQRHDAWSGGWGLGASSQDQTERGPIWAPSQNSSGTGTNLLFVPNRTQCGVLGGMPVRPHGFQSPASSRRISKLLGRILLRLPPSPPGGHFTAH